MQDIVINITINITLDPIVIKNFACDIPSNIAINTASNTTCSVPSLVDITIGLFHSVYHSLPGFNPNIVINDINQGDFYYNIMIEKFKTNLVFHHTKTQFFIKSHSFTFTPSLFSANYLYYMWVQWIINHPYFQAVFYGLTIFLMRLLLSLMSITNNNKHMGIILMFFSFITRVGAKGTGLSTHSINIILATLGNLFYIVTSVAYDFFCAKSSIRRETIVHHKVFNAIIRNVLYCISIIIGVYATNGVWYFCQSLDNARDIINIGAVIMPICSVACYFGWIVLVRPTTMPRRDILNSVARGVLECFGFNSTAFSNYAQWNLWLSNVPHPIIVALSVFTPLHLVLSFICIFLEIYDSHQFLYAILNYISFTSVAFSTNAIVEYFTRGNPNFLTSVIISTLMSVITTIFAPPVYRGQIFDRNRTGLRQRFIYISRFTISYYALVLSFVLATYISFNYAFF